MITVNQYTALIPSQHSDKPKFVAMVSAVAQCWVELQNSLDDMPSKFDLDTAVGVNLDAIGEWVGLSRNIKGPLNVFFSFDTVGLGLDEGAIIYLPFQPTEGITTATDDTYRIMLRGKILLNAWQGDTDSLIHILQTIFAPATVTVADNMDMSMSVTVTGQPPSILFKTIVTEGYLPLKPAGVSVEYTFS